MYATYGDVEPTTNRINGLSLSDKQHQGNSFSCLLQVLSIMKTPPVT